MTITLNRQRRRRTLLIGVCAVLIAGRTFSQQGMGSSTKAVPRGSAKLSVKLEAPTFDLRDVAGEFGITAPNYYGGERTKRHILEMTGNGVGLIDYNNDGRLDVLLVNGGRLDGSSRPSVLYRNLGAGRFADVTRESGLATSGWAQGICAGDIDNDGFTDLFVTRYGDNMLLRNDRGHFRTLPFPSTTEQFNTGCTFIDYDRDGRLDLFVTTYVAFPYSQAQRATASCKWLGVSVFCGPRGFPGGMSRLFHNEGAGRFKDVSGAAGMKVEGLHYGLGVTSADFDEDGWPDIFVACDSTPSILFHNNQNGTFTDMAVEAGVAYGDNGEEQGGMGVAAFDFDNDGRVDIVRTNFMDETTTTLYRNMGDNFFANETVTAGLGLSTRMVAWGVQAVDVDQDGFRDLIIGNGHIYPELASSGVNEPFEMAKLFYWNLRNGAYRNVTRSAGAGVNAAKSSRGLAIGDLDGDGSPEIVISNMNGRPTVLKNFAPKGNALVVKLTGVRSNRSAIGTRVTVRTGSMRQMSTVTSGSSYLSQSDFRQHFGLGAVAKVDEIGIVWPDGQKETVRNVPAGEVHIREGDGVVR